MAFEITPSVEVYRDEDGRVTQLRHTRQGYDAAEAGLESATAVEVARSYVREVAELYGLSEDETAELADQIPGEPRIEPTRLKEDEQRSVIETTVVKYQQTHLGLPVWNSTLAVVVAGDPPAVVSSNSTLHGDVSVPDRSVDDMVEMSAVSPMSLSEAIGVDDDAGTDFLLNGVRLLVYRYDPDERLDRAARRPSSSDNTDDGTDIESGGHTGDAGVEGADATAGEPTVGVELSDDGDATDTADAGQEGPEGDDLGSGAGAAGPGHAGPPDEGLTDGAGSEGPIDQGGVAEGAGFTGPGTGGTSDEGAGFEGPGHTGPDDSGSPAAGSDTSADGGAGATGADEGPEASFTAETAGTSAGSSVGDTSFEAGPPTLPLPPVPDEIQPGQHYVVREVLFRLTVDEDGDLNWRAFVEPESGAVLYLRALTAGATCAVFETDPITRTGSTLTPDSPAAQLDAARTLGLVLMNLGGPAGGTQSLSGTYARIQDTNSPPVAPPTTTSPFSFTYSAVTDDFSAANAYYHTDWMYRLVQGMGFDVATYFDGTTFPVPVDHRGKGSQRNASANGNAAGNGMEKFLYGLAKVGGTVGIATTVRVCLHEFGHALLWDHVNSPNFGWAHSAGDTLAAVLNDPGSRAPDRFETFPFVAAGDPIDRRHDRDVAAGWAWGGTRDDRRYGSEQILSTVLFRVYRVTGGDDGDVGVQRFAARYLAYLVIRAIGTLTAMSTDPRTFVTALEDADELTANFEGHAGGAWHKVIRWSFEKQGLFQPPGAPRPVTGRGAPPPVDVWIDDGRRGEYEPYPTDIGRSPGVWNRLSPDGGTTNQQPAAGATNHLYVRVANRGTDPATNVVVKAFQGRSGSALTWPGDWSAVKTASLAAPDIPSGGEVVVGPFSWTPANAGPVSVLASVAARGDTSNADTVNGPIANTRLVPQDNNLAQRDLTATGGGGCVQICSGATTPGATAWQAFGTQGLYLDVDTRACDFTVTPRYFTTIHGWSSHWATTGATSIYNPTRTGFRVYLRWAAGGALSPAQANAWKWHITWTGVVDG